MGGRWTGAGVSGAGCCAAGPLQTLQGAWRSLSAPTLWTHPGVIWLFSGFILSAKAEAMWEVQRAFKTLPVTNDRNSIQAELMKAKQKY